MRLIALYPILCRTMYGNYFTPSELMPAGSEDECRRAWNSDKFVRILTEMPPIMVEAPETPAPRDDDHE